MDFSKLKPNMNHFVMNKVEKGFQKPIVAFTNSTVFVSNFALWRQLI